MAGKQYTQDQLVERREALARYRIQRRKLEEARKIARRKAFWRNVKLFFFITGVVVSGLAVFVLFNGAWSIIDPIMNN